MKHRQTASHPSRWIAGLHSNKETEELFRVGKSSATCGLCSSAADRCRSFGKKMYRGIWHSLILEIHFDDCKMENVLKRHDCHVMFPHFLCSFGCFFFLSKAWWSFKKIEVSAEEDLDPKEGQLQNLEERLTTDGYLEEVKEKFEAQIFWKLGSFSYPFHY